VQFFAYVPFVPVEDVVVVDGLQDPPLELLTPEDVVVVAAGKTTKLCVVYRKPKEPTASKTTTLRAVKAYFRPFGGFLNFPLCGALDIGHHSQFLMCTGLFFTC
jgi:hypothetical protein